VRAIHFIPHCRSDLIPFSLFLCPSPIRFSLFAAEDKKIVSLEPPVYWDDEGERRTVADYSFITTGTVIHLVLGLRGD
jgi:hypothetical protein